MTLPKHIPGLAGLVAGADLAVPCDALELLLQRRQVVGQSIQARRTLRPAGRAAIVIDSLRTSMPRSMIDRAVGIDARTGNAAAPDTDDMGWSPQHATCEIVVGGSGDSVSTREELTHAKAGRQPSHTF